MTTFEEQYQIIPVADAIARFLDSYPAAVLTKVQLEYQGPFLKYDIEGQDDQYRYSVNINAQTGEFIKQKEKAIKAKSKRKNVKALNIDNLLPMTEIQSIALENLPVNQPIQWELDTKRERTLWKVEVTNDKNSILYEIKIDAQDGTIVQSSLKS